jgi:ATP-binding cassette subfamily B protein
VPIMFYFLNGVFPKFRKLRWKSFSRVSRMTSMVNDNLTGARVVKAFGREDSEIVRFAQVNQEINKNDIMIGNMSTTVFPLFSYIISLGSLAIWGFGGWMILKGTMELGTLMTFLGYIGLVYGPISYFSHYVDWWSNCISSAQRIFEILDTEPEIIDSPNPVRMPNLRGEISLKNIFFAYEPNKNVLHGVSLDIKAGEMIGLVGHSGAGKSTLTNLITRLYDVNEGGIFIDGVNIKEIAVNDLRPHIGMVLQDTYLFDGTLAENIAYARPGAPLEDIIAAAKAANAHDFIMKLNDGYNTVVGTRRINLSGGERQRISIARAILHDPKILILDEATASLDTDTERMIQQALERLVKGRTTIAIAHRLSTLRNADRLAVVEKGKIVEVGTHAELTAMKGSYYKMIERQQEALKIKGVAE